MANGKIMAKEKERKSEENNNTIRKWKVTLLKMLLSDSTISK